MKQKVLSILALLLMTATGAWADTTVTWTASDMSGIYIDFLDGEANNNTIKGITVTSSGGGGAGASWESTYIDLNSGSTTITFTSSVGNIKSIAITAENIDMSSIPSGWTTDYSTLSWSGEASTTVPLPLSGWTEISGISGIVFTIESTVNVTGVTLAPTSATLTLGETETVTLIPTVLPAEATDKSVTWSSSDEAVATVTDGVVTAVAAGTATITVTTTDGAKTATCAVTVAAPAASTYTVTLKEGTEDATSWTIAPAEATTTGVAAGTEVKATYGGTKKVKSVKAVKKAAPSYTMAAAATTSDKGKLICTAGHIHVYGEDAACTAGRVAKIIYVGPTGHATYNHGLALALEDMSTLLTWDNSGANNDGKTAAEWCSAWNTSKPVTDAEWLLASKDQWNYMLGTNGAGSSTTLLDGFTSVGGSNLESQDYWSSTEYESNTDEAWMFNFGYDWWYDYSKGTAYPQVRACLAF